MKNYINLYTVLKQVIRYTTAYIIHIFEQLLLTSLSCEKLFDMNNNSNNNSTINCKLFMICELY